MCRLNFWIRALFTPLTSSRVRAGESSKRQRNEGLAIVPSRCNSRARAGTRRIILDRMVVHLLTEVVEKVQTFEAASTFYGGMVSGFKDFRFYSVTSF